MTKKNLLNLTNPSADTILQRIQERWVLHALIKVCDFWLCAFFCTLLNDSRHNWVNCQRYLRYAPAQTYNITNSQLSLPGQLSVASLQGHYTEYQLS